MTETTVTPSAPVALAITTNLSRLFVVLSIVFFAGAILPDDTEVGGIFAIFMLIFLFLWLIAQVTASTIRATSKIKPRIIDSPSVQVLALVVTLWLLMGHGYGYWEAPSPLGFASILLYLTTAWVIVRVAIPAWRRSR